MPKSKSPPKEGQLYKQYIVDGHTFTVYYGYYNEEERENVDPLPVFPDFVKSPVYSNDGRPVVTVIQPPCDHYKPLGVNQKEDWCGDCRYYSDADSEISLCNCEKNKIY